MIIVLNNLQKVLDLFFLPFAGCAPFWGLLAISAVTGVLMVVVYKYTSNQKGIAQTKELIKGHLLETWIYREQVGVMLRAQKKVIVANLKYMALNLKPLAVMMIPVLFILINLNFRYGVEPVSPGGTTLIETTRKVVVTLDEMDESIEVPAGVIVETPGVRIAEKGETFWRLRVEKPGSYIIKIKASGIVCEKLLQSGTLGIRVAPLRSDTILDGIFYPGEPTLGDGPFKSIEISYKDRSPAIPGTHWNPHWIIQFFVLSILFGFIMKGPLKVEI